MSVRTHLTDEKVSANGCPTNRRYINIYDTECAGLFCTIYPSGKRVWGYRWRYAKKQHQRNFGDFPGLTVHMARNRAAEARQRVKNGRDATELLTRDEERLTVQGFFEQYIATKDFRSKSVDHQRSFERIMTQRCLPTIGSIPLSVFSFDDAEAVTIVPRDEGKVATAKQAYAFMRAMMSVAVKAKLVPFNPLKGQQPDNLHLAPRERFLSIDEMRWVWRITDGLDAFSGVMRIILLTGCRLGEAVGLTWDDIDDAGATPTLTFSKTKIGKPRVLPLTDDLRAVIKTQEARRQGPIFNTTRHAVWFRLNRAQKSAGLKQPSGPFSPHALRASVITHCTDYGVAENVGLRLVVGHQLKSDVEEKHYYRGPMLNSKARILDAWADWLRDQGVIDDGPIVLIGKFDVAR